MTQTWKRCVFVALIAMAVEATPGIAQRGEGTRGIVLPGGSRGEGTRGIAAGTRAELDALFNEWYPPSLKQVLQLDPSLITNSAYLASYPRLVTFLEEHPEVARNPAFFLGNPEQIEIVRRQQGVPNWNETIAVLLTLLLTATIILTVAWIVKAVIDHRRWLRLSKLQTEAQTKLMDRFNSNEDLLAFVQTPAGKRFLESSAVPIEPRNIAAPVGRILWSVQAGLVLLVAGVGLQFVSTRLVEAEAAQAFFVLGVLVIAVGIGFIVSSLASYELSRRLGLLDQTATRQTPSS